MRFTTHGSYLRGAGSFTREQRFLESFILIRFAEVQAEIVICPTLSVDSVLSVVVAHGHLVNEYPAARFVRAWSLVIILLVWILAV